MKLKVFKQIAFMLVAVIAGMGLGVAIMWNGHGASAAGESGHGHELIVHVGTEATCEETGMRTYWECPECHLYFSDADGFNEIKAEELVTWRVIPQRKHQLVYRKQKNATCTDDGEKAHWHCSVCGKDFKDQEGKLEFTSDAMVIPSAHVQHNKVLVPYEAATCEHDGHFEHYKCTKCDQVFINERPCRAEDVVIPGGHHTNDTLYHACEDATCEHAGHVAYYECSDCGKKFADRDCKEAINNTVISQLGHWSDGGIYHVPEKAPTCTEDGNPEYWICTKGCGQKFKNQTCTIPLNEHAFDDYQKFGHDFQYIYEPCNRNEVLPARRLDDHNDLIAGSDAVQYYTTCVHCGEHKALNSVRGFAEVESGCVHEYAEENGKVIDVCRVTLSHTARGYDATVKIKVAANYNPAYSCYRYNGEVYHSMNVTSIVSGVYQMELPIHFDAIPMLGTELVWEFDWDGIDGYEQKIKVVIA